MIIAPVSLSINLSDDRRYPYLPGPSIYRHPSYDFLSIEPSSRLTIISSPEPKKTLPFRLDLMAETLPVKSPKSIFLVCWVLLSTKYKNVFLGVCVIKNNPLSSALICLISSPRGNDLKCSSLGLGSLKLTRRIPWK